jgi:hypothetical protein
LDVARTETVLKEDTMSDDWKDCERPWTIDEFVWDRRKSAPEAVVWSTEPPKLDGHYWIYRPDSERLDVLEVAWGDLFLGGAPAEQVADLGEWLYGPRIAPPEAPK